MDLFQTGRGAILSGVLASLAAPLVLTAESPEKGGAFGLLAYLAVTMHALMKRTERIENRLTDLEKARPNLGGKDAGHHDAAG